jgi:hypothetical protein
MAESNARKEWGMFESQLVREWTADARREGRLATGREYLLLILEERFLTPVAKEVVDLINRQDNPAVLQDWFLAAVDGPSLEDFLAVLKR